MQHTKLTHQSVTPDWLKNMPDSGPVLFDDMEAPQSVSLLLEMNLLRVLANWTSQKRNRATSNTTSSSVPPSRHRLAQSRSLRFCLVSLTAICSGLAFAQDAQSALTKGEYQLMGDINMVFQNELPFKSSYAGPNSFLSRRESSFSHLYTLYFGKRIKPNVDFYFDPQMARGGGISEALGIAGYVNGDVVRNPSLSQEVFPGRYFIRWTIGQNQATTHIDEDRNQIAADVKTNRLVFTAGKMGTNDLFDTNAYANSTADQFLNWAFLNSPAYDYAADTRGYTIGMALEWINPDWSARIGSFQMPKVANGLDLDGDLAHSRGDQVEFEVHPKIIGKNRSNLRLLSYRNLGNMGDYREAIANAGSGVPDVTSTRKPRVKQGLNLSWDQPLADDGETGVFLRSAENFGATESFAYTEAERSFSAGFQIAGSRWHAAGDRFGFAFGLNKLGLAHRAYLADGGLGFLLGDGKLNYGQEQVLEAYYTRKLSKDITLSLDFQGITNPGYNRDRGPVGVVGLRLHYRF